MCNISRILKFVLFADDTNTFYSADSLELLSIIISQQLNKLHNWFAVNKLSLNINKTNYMVFGKGRVTSDIAVTINQNIIERIYDTTFLGIIIDDKISWKAHKKSKLAMLSLYIWVQLCDRCNKTYSANTAVVHCTPKVSV